MVDESEVLGARWVWLVGVAGIMQSTLCMIADGFAVVIDMLVLFQ